MSKPYALPGSKSRLITQYHFYSEPFSGSLINRWESTVLQNNYERRAMKAFIKAVRSLDYMEFAEIPKFNQTNICLKKWIKKLVKELAEDTCQPIRALLSGKEFKSVWLNTQVLTAYMTFLFKTLYDEAQNCADLLDGNSRKACSLNYTSKWLHLAMGYALAVYCTESLSFTARFKEYSQHSFDKFNWLGLAEPSWDEAKKFPRSYLLTDLRFVRTSIAAKYIDVKAMDGYYVNPNLLFWFDKVFPSINADSGQWHLDPYWLEKRFY